MEDVFNHTTMPGKLKQDIEKIWDEKCVGFPTSGFDENGNYRPCPYMNMVWLHCDGEDDPDKENIGPVNLHFDALKNGKKSSLFRLRTHRSEDFLDTSIHTAIKGDT